MRPPKPIPCNRAGTARAFGSRGTRSAIANRTTAGILAGPRPLENTQYGGPRSRGHPGVCVGPLAPLLESFPTLECATGTVGAWGIGKGQRDMIELPAAFSTSRSNMNGRHGCSQGCIMFRMNDRSRRSHKCLRRVDANAPIQVLSSRLDGCPSGGGHAYWMFRRILPLVSVLGVGGTNLPHHGGRSADPAWLYSWARPRTVMVSGPGETPYRRGVESLPPAASVPGTSLGYSNSC
jgi:hypothetical protein